MVNQISQKEIPKGIRESIGQMYLYPFDYELIEKVSARTYLQLRRNWSQFKGEAFTKENFIHHLETDGVYARNFGNKAIKELEEIAGFNLGRKPDHWKLTKKGDTK